MAKIISGERRLKVGKKTYTLRLGFEETSNIEDRYGNFNDILIEISSGKARYSLMAFILSEMAQIAPTKAFAIMMENHDKVLSIIVDVMLATLNPEKVKGDDSGE